MTYSTCVTLAVLVALTSNAFAQNGTWQRTALFRDYWFTDIECADSNNCMAMGSYQGEKKTFVMRTTDGGRTWSESFKDSLVGTPVFHRPIRLFALEYPSPRLALVAADSGRFLRSTDQGSTWDMLKPGDWAAIQELSMADDTVGVAIYALRDMWRTTDGGLTWNLFALPQAADTMYYERPVAVDARTIRLLIYNGGQLRNDRPVYLLSSFDAGQTWRWDSLPTNTISVVFRDSLRGWALPYRTTGVGDQTYDYISSTTDGGVTWSTVLDTFVTPGFGWITDVVFVDRAEVLAVGGVAKVYRSTDDGFSWRQEQIDNTEIPAITAAAAPGGTQLIATNRGEILRYEKSAGSTPERDARGLVCSVHPNPESSGSSVLLTLAVDVPSEIRIDVLDVVGRSEFQTVELFRNGGTRHVRIPTALMSGPHFLRAQSSTEVVVVPFVVEE